MVSNYVRIWSVIFFSIYVYYIGQAIYSTYNTVQEVHSSVFGIEKLK